MMSRKSVIMIQRSVLTPPDKMWTGLAQFLDDQCKQRGLSWREASLKAGLDHGAISRFISGTTPSPASCRKLATLFGVEEDLVLVLAGHKIDQTKADNPISEAITLTEELMRDLPESLQWKIYKMIRLEHDEFRSQQSDDDTDTSEQVLKAS